ncbi:BON domain-containing protein [Dongia sp.]|uniref:BON domain-containing protein n=1 Tax=Dongia sp. TaxID=1977262 RepID=UPI0035B08510
MNRARIPHLTLAPMPAAAIGCAVGSRKGVGFLLVFGMLGGGLLGGCSPVGTAVGVAATTINLATQERGLVTGVDDNLIWVGINERLFRKDADLFQKVSLQVHEGRVLLTGFVQKPEHRVLASELAWQARGVREVDNQIQLGPSLNVGDYSEDAWLIARLRVKLMADAQVRANNYSIDCIRSTIYLTGVAQDAAELQRVIDHARDVAYVDAVVSRVRLQDAPLLPIPDEKPVMTATPGAPVEAAAPVDAPSANAAEASAAPADSVQAAPLP